MLQSPVAHFSRKVLLLSFIFLLANLGIYALKSLSSSHIELESMAPKLLSATLDELEIKTAFEDDFKPGIKGQEIYSGTTIRTSEAEFAELVLGNNVIKLDESTELLLVRNESTDGSSYVPENPRLVFELKSGGVWVNAFDLIEVKTPRAKADLHHAVGILTYSMPINRGMVVTGDLDLSLLDETGKVMSEFVVPLHNQVTFVDSQITDVYQALKPSKLKKELKMTPISAALLEDEWIARNANEFVAEHTAFTDSFIQSGLAYKIRKILQTGQSYLTFTPEAKRSLALEKGKTLVNYLLGGVTEDQDLVTAQRLIADFESLVASRKNDPLMKELVVRTLFAIEEAEFGSPAFALKESLMAQVEASEGAYVYRVYLTDLRRTLLQNNITVAESISKKWQERWTDARIKENLTEFNRQTQILNHTMLSFIDLVPLSLLEVYDQAGTSSWLMLRTRKKCVLTPPRTGFRLLLPWCLSIAIFWQSSI